jgi:hypothetical protein
MRSLVALLTLAVTVVCVAHAFSAFQQNLLFTRVQTEVSFWGRGDYHPTPATITATRQQLQTLVTHSPDHPDYLALRANAAVWLAYWSQQESTAGQPDNTQQAIASQQSALLSRPAHRFSWNKLAEYLGRGELTVENRALALLAQSRINTLQVSVAP